MAEQQQQRSADPMREAEQKREEARVAQRDLKITVGEIQRRLKPGSLAKSGAEAAADYSADGVERGRRAIQRHPVAVGFAGAVAGLLALRRFTNLFQGRVNSMSMKETDFQDTADADRPNAAQRGWRGAKDSAASARDKAAEAAHGARERTAESYDRARGYVADRYDATRRYSAETWDRTRERADRARARTTQGIAENPLSAALLGAIAGAAIGLLLPRTQRENRTLGRTRDDLVDQASAAARAAKEAGEQRLNELGVKEQAKSHLQEMRAEAGDVARSAKDAAVAEARRKPSQG